MKDKLYYLWMGFIEFLGNIEMRIKYSINKKYYSSLSEDDIPKDTFYCYSGCRCQTDNGCPYMDYSIIAGSPYCHYVEGGIYDIFLYDECKICGVSEDIEEYEAQIEQVKNAKTKPIERFFSTRRGQTSFSAVA